MSSKYKQQGNLDANHSQMIKYFRDLHCPVADTSGQGGFVDAVVCNHRRETIIVEIKTVTGKFTCSQLESLAKWKGFSAFVTDETEAYDVCSNPTRYCLNDIEKAKLLSLATTRRKESPSNDPEVLVTTVKKLLGRS